MNRASYETFVAPIPEGMWVTTSCRNASCVNPGHLELVTPKENYERGGADSLVTFAAYYEQKRAATHCPNGHPWNELNTRRDEVQRHCRTCNREAAAERRSDADFRAAEQKRNRELYAENSEPIRERKRVWRAENRDAINARVRVRNKARYELLKAQGMCIRVGCRSAVVTEVLCEVHRQESGWRNYGLKDDVPASYKARGLTMCWLCGGDFGGDEPLWHDHLIPRSLGGPNVAWNFAPSHRNCNIARSNTPLAVTLLTAAHGEQAVRDFPEEYQHLLIE